MGKLKTILISIGVGIVSVLLFIFGRGFKTSGSIKRRVDKNREDLRELSESDRVRNEESGTDLDRQRESIDSEKIQLERERDLNQQGRESTEKVGCIIDNARDDVRRIMGHSSGDDEK